LVAVGSTLYGTTQSDGPAGHGEVFAINADGTNFHVVHAFAGGTSDGSAPTGLTVVGSELVGTSQGGGAQNLGTVFSMNTDGTGFQLLHSFVGTDGSGLKASVAFDGSVLYGTASGGGPLNGGAVFSLNPDGSNFQLLHAFSQSGGPSGPAGELAVINGKLMGTTSSGGNAHHGAAFSMTTDGASFEVLHLFPTASGEENGPNDQLILLGTTLYGTTNGSGNAGAVFALAVPEPSALVLALALVGCATLIACGVRRRRRSIAGVG
jgi:uncharacterized repeat protein (TIGR03803 family)